MKKQLTLITLVLTLSWVPLAIAGTQPVTKDHSTTANTFTYKEEVHGVRAEFQVMTLASMKMKDPSGNTHHVMVKFYSANSKDQIKNAVGKIKVISPSGKERVESLKNYSGIFTANFTFNEEGKYGVICLFKVSGQKRLVKFWYPHG